MGMKSVYAGLLSPKGLKSIWFQFLLVASIMWCFHVVAVFLVQHYNLTLHISIETIPLYKRPDVSFNRWLVLPIAGFGLYLVSVRSVLKAKEPIPLPVLIITFIGLKIVIDVSVTLINGSFLPIGIKEYIDDVPKFASIGDILQHYADRATTLTRHAGTHPPGAVLMLWLVTRLFVYNYMVKAWLIILSAPLVLIPIYRLATKLHDRRTAVYALSLYLVTPNAVLYTAICMDAFFALFLVFSLYLICDPARQTTTGAILTGLSLAISMFFTFATTFLGLYFIALTVAAYFWKRQEFANHLVALTVSGTTFCLVYLIVYALTGYNLLANLMAAMEVDKSVIGTGYETLPRYFLVSGTNLFGFFTLIGVPTIVFCFRQLSKEIHQLMTRQESSIFLPAYIVVLIPIAFSTLYMTETERIWLFMVPFVLIPAAKNLATYVEQQRNDWLFYIVVSLLFVQTLGFEILIDTRW